MGHLKHLPSVAGLGLTAAITAAAPAAAVTDIKSTRNATTFVQAIAEDPDEVVRAKWIKLPGSGRPAGVATVSGEKFSGFPREGKTFGILSTGDATAADADNDEPDLSNSNKGPVHRGARDVVVLRIDFTVRPGQRCVSFDFKFLSEEFDEFVDSPFNDAFIAEQGRSTWSSGGTRSAKITAPRSFARSRESRFISINQQGDFSAKESRAANTTYDAATRTLRASSRVKPGKRRIFLSIFDQGDRLYDSSVFIDRFRVDDRKPCSSGTAAI